MSEGLPQLIEKVGESIQELNKELKELKEVFRKLREAKEVRIKCHLCDGKGYYEEELWPHGERVYVKCEECGGRGWIKAIQVSVKEGETREEA